MARWDSEGEERLRAAAIELFLEHGFENVTVAQIADRAGLTRRTFSRYFADKRDVLFARSDQLPGALAEAVRRADPHLPPYDALIEALASVAGVLADRVAEHAQQRRAIIAASSELQERAHTKFAAVAAAVGAALRERGADGATARLLADVGVAIFRQAFDRWVDAPQRHDLVECVREAATQLSDAVS